MHFALRGYLFVALTALLAVAGTWSDDPAFSGAWLFPAFLLLAGLAVWVVCLFKAYRGERWKMPLVGGWAERLVGG